MKLKIYYKILSQNCQLKTEISDDLVYFEVNRLRNGFWLDGKLKKIAPLSSKDKKWFIPASAIKLIEVMKD